MDECNLTVAGLDASNAEPIVTTNVTGKKAGLVVIEQTQLYGFISLKLHREHRV